MPLAGQWTYMYVTYICELKKDILVKKASMKEILKHIIIFASGCRAFASRILSTRVSSMESLMSSTFMKFFCSCHCHSFPVFLNASSKFQDFSWPTNYLTKAGLVLFIFWQHATWTQGRYLASFREEKNADTLNRFIIRCLHCRLGHPHPKSASHFQEMLNPLPASGRREGLGELGPCSVSARAVFVVFEGGRWAGGLWFGGWADLWGGGKRLQLSALRLSNFDELAVYRFAQLFEIYLSVAGLACP